MARNTAQQGAVFERTVIHELEGCQGRVKPCRARTHRGFTGYGYDCVRSAASKGKIDIVAFGPLRTYECGATPDAIQLHIQCKLTDPQIGPTARMDLMDLALRGGALAIVAYWAKDPATGLKRVHYRELTGPGPKDWRPWAPGEDN